MIMHTKVLNCIGAIQKLINAKLHTKVVNKKRVYTSNELQHAYKFDFDCAYKKYTQKSHL